MTALRPTGINHLALSTTDMRRQLDFWCGALGLPLRALYWMHGAEDTCHGFVELAPNSYVALVQHPDNDDQVEFGVSHADGSLGPVRGGSMQHVALHAESFDHLLAVRDRLRAYGVQVFGPLDHGFIQSIYFSGPEGLNLEVASGGGIDPSAWVDPGVVEHCGIGPDELADFIEPPTFDRPAEAVPQPDVAHPDDERARHDPQAQAEMMAMADGVVWETLSRPEPPIVEPHD